MATIPPYHLGHNIVRHKENKMKSRHKGRDDEQFLMQTEVLTAP